MRALLAAATLLLLAAAARADSLLDRPAPDPAVRMWVVGEPPPAWKALQGRCALLELTDPDDLISQGLESRTVEIAARAAERKLVVVSVAVGTGADDEKAREFAKRFKVTWPFGVDRKSETLVAAGMPNIPRYFLIAPDGRVMWEGSPGDLDDRTLAGFAERARLWRPAEIAKSLRPAADLFTKGRFGAAWRKAEEVRAETEKRRKAGLPVDEGEDRDRALLADGVKAIATIRLRIADGLAKERFSLDAREMLEEIASGFAGTDWEKRAREALAAMADDERAQAEITASLRLREIVSKIRPPTRYRVEQAIQAIDNLLITYGNLRTGERAREEQARLRKLLETL